MAKFDEKSQWLDEHFSPAHTPLLDNLEQQSLDSDDENETILPLTTQGQSRPKRSTTFLDGLRGIAALCVFTQHLIGGDDHQHGFGANGHRMFISLPFIRVFYSGGAAAVAVFFVLSGFVISQSAIRLFQKDQRQQCIRSLVSSTVRRPIRLYFPCFAVALVVAILKQLPNKVYPDVPWSVRQKSLTSELVHWFVECVTYFNPFQRHGWTYAKFSYDVVVWTIPMELKGSMLVYALTPICCFGLASQLWSVGFLSVAAVTLLHFGWWSSGCFVAGLLLSIIDLYTLDVAHFFRHFSSGIARFLVHISLVLGYYLLCQPAMDGHPEESLNTPGWHFLSLCIPSAYDKDNYYRFWQSYGALFFVYATLRLHWLQAVLKTRPLQYLGKVSFMLYLIHLPMMYFVGDRVSRVFGQTYLGVQLKWWDSFLYIPDVGPKGLSLRFIALWTVMLAICLFGSHFATRFLDEPFVRLGKKLTRKLGLS